MDNQHDMLPQSIGERIILGMLCAGAVPFAAVFLYALTIGPMGATWAERLIRVALWEFFAALLVVGLCGLVWAVAAPSWLRPVTERWAMRLMLLALVPPVILFGLAVWP